MSKIFAADLVLTLAAPAASANHEAAYYSYDSGSGSTYSANNASHVDKPK